jgi:hypothetical protein
MKPKKFTPEKRAEKSVKKIMSKNGYVYKTGDYLITKTDSGEIIKGFLDMERGVLTQEDGGPEINTNDIAEFVK